MILFIEICVRVAIMVALVAIGMVVGLPDLLNGLLAGGISAQFGYYVKINLVKPK